MLSEADIINHLKTAFPDNIGDDAAVIKGTNNQHYVITKDLLVEDVHFRTTYFSPMDLAYKALQVNLSDLAAMGASPQFILCGISIPIAQAQYAEEFLSSLVSACKKADVVLIGGDTTKSPDKLFISITAIGTALQENIKYRSTAKITDYICVAGNLGYAHIGLTVCERSVAALEEYKMAFLQPNAKINEGLWFASKPNVTSMMDISDGLFIDLKRLLNASNLSGYIQLEKLAPSSSFIKACDLLGFDPINTLLTGGEDYGLLFTVESNSYQKLAQDFMQTFGYSLKCIGHTSSGIGVHFSEHGKPKTLVLKPFSHFGETL